MIICQADFLNHIIATLGASLQRWKFGYVNRYVADITFANGHTETIGFDPQTEQFFSKCEWLAARLNGQVRDEDGYMLERA